MSLRGESKTRAFLNLEHHRIPFFELVHVSSSSTFQALILDARLLFENRESHIRVMDMNTGRYATIDAKYLPQLQDCVKPHMQFANEGCQQLISKYVKT